MLRKKKRFGHLVPKTTSPEGLGVYLHFPWCLKKCPYCDFLSVAVPKTKDGKPPSAEEARKWLPHEKYADALILEWRNRIKVLKPPLPELRSVFFGGGTPSLWKPESLGRVLQEIRRGYPGEIASDLEISVECNPTSLDLPHANALNEVGVGRLSIGVQNLDAGRLEFLGRLHDSQAGLTAVSGALGSAVTRVSADLIFGIYSQSPAEAESDARTIGSTGVGHVSAYSLTIEENTRFGALNAQGKLPLLDDALAADSYLAVEQTLEGLGLRHYEISNFARPGEESIHNLGYWLGRDYLGLGTGAFGTISTRDGRYRYRNLLSPDRYMKYWGTSSHDPSGKEGLAPESVLEREEITAEIAHQESFLLGLRTIYGVSPDEMAEHRGGDPWGNGRKAVIRRLVDEGRLRKNEDRIFIPKEHWLFADGIIRKLL